MTLQNQIVFKKATFFICSIQLFIDALNGYLAYRSIGLPISLITKGVLIILVLLTSLKKQQQLLLYFLITFLLSIFFFHKLLINNIYASYGVVLMIRVIYVVSLFGFFKREFLLDTIKTGKKIKVIVYRNWIILLVSIFLGSLGFGFNSYETSNLGTKGFFIAGNELSGVYFILSAIVLFYSVNSKAQYLLNSILTISLGVCIASKTAILSGVLNVLIIPLVSKKVKFDFKAIFKSCCVLLVILYVLFYALTNSSLLKRWEHFFAKGGLQYLILSGRSEFIVEPLAYLFGSDIVSIFLGNPLVSTVELDLFDVLLNFGIIGVIFIYSLVIYLLYHSYTRKNNKYGALALYTNIILVCISTLSGHIIFSGLAGAFIALINSQIFRNDSK